MKVVPKMDDNFEEDKMGGGWLGVSKVVRFPDSLLSSQLENLARSKAIWTFSGYSSISE